MTPDELIREILQQDNLRIDHDAVTWLAANISGNRQKVRGELEKLITYKGNDNSPVSLIDARAACGEAGAQSLDDLVYSVGGGQPEHALRTYNQLMEEGVNFIVVVRALQNHFRRLHMINARMDQGEDLDSAMRKLAPPIFFKQEPAFKSQAQRWNLKTLDRVLSRLTDLEASCKQTGAPVETLCGQAVLAISASRA